MIAAVILIGAPGSGKSVVLDALATRLEIDGVAHGAIESEELARGFPLLAGPGWIDQLAAVLKLQREAGRRLFLIAATTESDDELRGVLAAAAADATLTVCLVASADAVGERLERREPARWPGKRRLIAHARELATTIPRLRGIDQAIDTTERDAEDVAREIYAQIGIDGLARVTR